jgi:retron-type reverse transcriptase
LDHAHLREFLQLRVRDGVLKRLICKWLKAGVLEEGSVSYPNAGSPQGGVVSPLLANLNLHYALAELDVVAAAAGPLRSLERIVEQVLNGDSLEVTLMGKTPLPPILSGIESQFKYEQ